jgi:hypothetical protein
MIERTTRQRKPMRTRLSSLNNFSLSVTGQTLGHLSWRSSRFKPISNLADVSGQQGLRGRKGAAALFPGKLAALHTSLFR